MAGTGEAQSGMLLPAYLPDGGCEVKIKINGEGGAWDDSKYRLDGKTAR